MLWMCMYSTASSALSAAVASYFNTASIELDSVGSEI